MKNATNRMVYLKPRDVPFVTYHFLKKEIIWSKVKRGTEESKKTKVTKKVPSSLKKQTAVPVVKRGVGLINCHNSCYATVIAQTIVYSKGFMEKLETLEAADHKGTISHSIKDLKNQITTTDKRFIVPHAFLSALEKSVQRTIHHTPTTQRFLDGYFHDANEFYQYVLEAISSEITEFSPTTEKFVDSLYTFTVENTLTCTNCSNCVVTANPDRCVIIHVPASSEPLVLDNLIRQQLLSATEVTWNCNKCQNVKANKTVRLLSTPDILVVQLIRYEKIGEAVTLNKTPITCAFDMDLSHVMKESSMESRYQLYSMVCFLNETQHYTCFCRKEDEWFYFDDHTSWNTEPKGRKLAEGYLYFFEKV